MGAFFRGIRRALLIALVGVVGGALLLVLVGVVGEAFLLVIFPRGRPVSTLVRHP